MSELERKFGKYAIKNLSMILVGCYALGYIIQAIDSQNVLINYMTLNPYAIFMKGQVWRLFSWILIPPDQFSLLTIITLIFYYSIGKTLERTWGDWLYNVYIFSGMFFTFIAVSLIFVYYLLRYNQLSIPFETMPGVLEVFGISNTYGTQNALEYLMLGVSRGVSTYYINMSIFLAFAATFPEIQILLMFVIPIKMKYMGIAYAALLIYECVVGSAAMRVIIVASLLNFIVFYLIQRRRLHGSMRARVKQAARRHEFKQEYHREASAISKHKCAICGRTEADGADLEFRFCSKCNGNYEYCKDHLFTHKHVE